MPNDQSIQYITEVPMTAEQVLEKAAEILQSKYMSGEAFTSSEATLAPRPAPVTPDLQSAINWPGSIKPASKSGR